MPVGIKMYVTGDQQVSVFISNLADRSKDLTPALKEARATMLNSIDKNFKQGGRPIPWKPLALSTLRYKLRKGYSPLPLTRTGQLRRSITGAIIRETGAVSRLIMGTAVHYSRYHQRGTRSIPKRSFLVFQEKDLEHIGRSIVNHVRGK